MEWLKSIDNYSLQILFLSLKESENAFISSHYDMEDLFKHMQLVEDIGKELERRKQENK